MTIRKRIEALYVGQSSAARRFRYTLLALDGAFIVFVVISSFFQPSLLTQIIDTLFAISIAGDFAARLYISRHRIKDLLHPTGIADIVVIISLAAPILGEGYAFLRVVRTFRLLRSYQTLKRLRHDFAFFRQHELTITAGVNLGLFIFVMTALVFETQHFTNPQIRNYIDALYFTVTTLTTTGFGDITLPGQGGRLLSVIIMIFGVSLFVRMIQVMFRPPKVRFPCPDCALAIHDQDAVHCKHCGRVLGIVGEGDV